MKYISMLRGINVSGQKKIKMDDLKTLYQDLGLKNVETYIQSGNVVFDSTSKNKEKLKQNIENGIVTKYKFHASVEIRTNKDMDNIIKANPFGPIDIEKDSKSVYVTFLSERPPKERMAEIHRYVKKPEKLVVKDSTVYIYCPTGYGKSKLSNNFVEQKLKVKATTRNWKTVNKLFEMSL